MGDSDAPLATGFCKVFLDFYPLTNLFPDVPSHNGILLLGSGVLNCAMSMLTIMWIKQNEFISNKDTGEENRREEAIQNAIFPVFVKVLWMSAFINIYAAVVTIMIPQTPNSRGSQGTNISFSFNYALMKALQHCVTEGIAFLLMQKGCGKYANKRAFLYTSIWGLLTFAVMYMSYGFGGVIFTRFNEIWNILLLLFYSLLWLTPQKHLFRRPAAIKYCQFWTFFRFLIMLINIFYMFDSTDNLGACGFIFVNLLILAVAQPVICYWTLKQDSRWWQGFDIFEGFRRRPATGSIRSPLLGTEIHLQSAQSLAVTLDQIPVTGQVKMLNFASLKLDMKKLLGSGSFSKVYRGTYRGSEVAIKLIYTADLTTEIIMRVAAEASILSSIRHPNVVHIVGLSVLPPSVCLILEICSFGSLSDIIRGYGFDWNATHRSPLSICRTDAVYLALGCARGLAAVHSYDATMCHCDVKSFNFLVDAHFNVKIADLELGIIDSSKKKDENHQIGADDNDIESSRGINSSGLGESRNSAAAAIAGSRKKSVDVDCMLGNWLAPEVLQDGKFVQASDIYSLGTVMWEIISRQLPFASDSQAHIHIKIREGYKHPMPVEYEGSPIAQLIDECWDPNPSKRPSGCEIVARLEVIQHNDCYGVIKHIEGPSPLKTAPLVEFYESNYKKPKVKRRKLNKLKINSYIDVNAKRKAESDYGWTTLFNFAAGNEKKSKPPVPFASIGGAEESKRLISVAESINVSDDFSTGNSSNQSQSQSGSHNTNSSLMEEAEISYASNFSDFGSTNTLLEVGASSLQSVQYIEGATRGIHSSVGSSGGRTISRSVMPRQDKLAPQLPRAALDAIGMVMDEDFWLPLNQSNSSWAVVTTQYPHVVMHATDQWYQMFGISPISSTHGALVSLVSLAESFAVFNQVPEDGFNSRLIEGSNLYVNQAANVNRNAKTLKTILKDLKNHREMHSVLSFYLSESRESVSSGVAAGGVTSGGGGYNMMCTLHGYPIYNGNHHMVYHDLSNNSSSVSPARSKDGVAPVYFAIQFNELKEQDAVEPEINLHDEMTGIYASKRATISEQIKSSFSGNEGIMGRFFSRPLYSSLTHPESA